MSFFNSFDDKMLEEFGIGLQDFRYIVISNKLFYLEGLTNVSSLADDEIVFSVKRKSCKVMGSNLKIKNLDMNTALVSGNIVGVSVL